eukprot:14628603-Alexandrium_andersonii.AAC.1
MSLTGTSAQRVATHGGGRLLRELAHGRGRLLHHEHAPRYAAVREPAGPAGAELLGDVAARL